MKPRFGLLFAEERRRKGIPAEDIAAEVGASKNSIYNIEACLKRASPPMATMLSYFVDASPRKRKQLLVAHALEVGLIDVSTLDEDALGRVVRLVDRERERSLVKKRKRGSRTRYAQRG